MTTRSRDRDTGAASAGELDRRDEALVARVREAYRAPERSAMRNAALDARLEERLREPRGGLAWRGAALGAAVATVLVLFVTWGSGDGVDEPGELPRLARQVAVPAPETDASTALEDALVALATGYEYGERADSEASIADDLEASLPTDYVAIESLFLGG